MFECWWILPAVLLLLLPWLKDWYRLIKQVFNSWNHPKNSEFSLQLRVYKGTRDVTAVGQFQGFPHKTDLVETSEIPKTAFPLIPHLSSCIKALQSETKQIEWQTVHDIWSVNHTVWFKFTEENLTKCGSVEVIIGISQSYKFCWMSLGILISWNQEDK